MGIFKTSLPSNDLKKGLNWGNDTYLLLANFNVSKSLHQCAKFPYKWVSKQRVDDELFFEKTAPQAHLASYSSISNGTSYSWLSNQSLCGVCVRACACVCLLFILLSLVEKKFWLPTKAQVKDCKRAATAANDLAPSLSLVCARAEEMIFSLCSGWKTYHYRRQNGTPRIQLV